MQIFSLLEGYLSTTALERVKDEFQNGGYDKLIITGLSYPGNYYQVSMDVKQTYFNNPNSDAEDTRNELIRNECQSVYGCGCSREGNYINNTLKSALAFHDYKSIKK